MTLDGAKTFFVVGSDEHNSRSGLAGSTGATDTVHVGLRCVGQIEVENMRQACNIKTACRDVGRHDGL
jgi:hypothetical protein